MIAKKSVGQGAGRGGEGRFRVERKCNTRTRRKENRNNRGNYLRARLCAEKSPDIEGGGGGVYRRKEKESQAGERRERLFPRDFLIIYRARVLLSFVARE